MPELVDLMLEGFECEADTFYSSSIILVGGSKRSPDQDVVYAHVPNLLSDPKDKEFAKIGDNPVIGMTMVPQTEFQRLKALKDDKNVFVVLYSNLYSATQGFFSVEETLSHPQTLPFFGDLERAEKYLRKFHEQGIDFRIPILNCEEGYVAGATFIVASKISEFGLCASMNSQLKLDKYARILAKPISD